MCIEFRFAVMIKSAFDNIEILIQTDFAQFLAEQLNCPRSGDTD